MNKHVRPLQGVGHQSRRTRDEQPPHRRSGRNDVGCHPSYALPLNEKRLFGWHAALFPTGYSGPYLIEVGRYRTCEIQLASV